MSLFSKRGQDKESLSVQVNMTFLTMRPSITIPENYVQKPDSNVKPKQLASITPLTKGRASINALTFSSADARIPRESLPSNITITSSTSQVSKTIATTKARVSKQVPVTQGNKVKGTTAVITERFYLSDDDSVAQLQLKAFKQDPLKLLFRTITTKPPSGRTKEPLIAGILEVNRKIANDRLSKYLDTLNLPK